MENTEWITEQFLQSAALKQRLAQSLATPISKAVTRLVEALLEGKKILVCGNGGSAADAQHFAAELVGRFEAERLGLAAIALTTDSSILTAVGNDYSYEKVFSRQVEALGQPDDVLIAISTSGNSANIIAAVNVAHEREMHVIVLTGYQGGKLVEQAERNDLILLVDTDHTARIQEVHILILHCLCMGIDHQLLNNNQA